MPNKPTMEVRFDSLPFEIGTLAGDWPGTLRQTARLVASVAMERALEFGEAHSVTIDVWGEDGRLLVTVSANVQASWPGSRAGLAPFA